MRTGLPRGARCGLLYRRRGRPPARHRRGRSPPRNPARPRRWCDAGPPGRQSVTAAQKAGAVGMVRNNGSDRDRGRVHIRKRIEPTRVGTPPSPAGRRRVASDRSDPLVGRRVRHCAGTAIRLRHRAPHNRRYRAPSGTRDCRSDLPATRQAAGAPSAGSQPFHINLRATRRWCDAGPLGTPKRHGGPEGRCWRNTGTATASGAVSVTVTVTASRRAIVDSQDGCRYTTQNGPCVAIGFQPVDGSGRSRPGHAENPAPSGCRVRFCAGATSRLRLASRTKCGPGSPGERDAVYSTGDEAGRRRAIGVVAALPINPRATTPMVRRWVAGTPMRHGGPEGRRCGHGPEQRQRPGQGPYPYPWAIKPTRIGTPPSPAGRRRYKHRSAPCSAHVS